MDLVCILECQALSRNLVQLQRFKVENILKIG